MCILDLHVYILLSTVNCDNSNNPSCAKTNFLWAMRKSDVPNWMVEAHAPGIIALQNDNFYYSALGPCSDAVPPPEEERGMADNFHLVDLDRGVQGNKPPFSAFEVSTGATQY
jgi:hypothetical protein